MKTRATLKSGTNRSPVYDIVLVTQTAQGDKAIKMYQRAAKAFAKWKFTASF